MKRVAVVVVMILLTLALYAGIPPVSSKLGPIVIHLEKGSVEETMIQAFQEEFTESWLEKYTVNEENFIVSYAPILAELLPMENLVTSRFQDGEMQLLSLLSDKKVSLKIKEGKIYALHVE